MLCLECGAEMRLVQVTEDTTMLVSGYEHHTWQCSGCSIIERRMTFTREKTPTPTVTMEPKQTVPAEPTQTAPGATTVPVGAAQTVAAKTTQTAPVELTTQTRQPPRFQTNTWAKAVNKVRKRETAKRQAAGETERRAQFNRFWNDLLLAPSPSASFEALSHVKSNEPVQSPTEPISSQGQIAHDEPIARTSKD
jgi:hypothetical protein